MASYYHHRGEYDRVIEMLDSGEVELKNFDLFFIEATANAIHFTKSGKWCHAMLTEIEKQGNNCLPILANTAGYIAADLNIELDRAEKLIRKAVKAFPNESSYLDSLAWVLFRQQKYSEAAQEIQKALKFRPVSQSCCILFFHAAEIHLALGNKKQAREFFDRAVKNFDYNEKLFPDFSPEQIKDLENRLK
jgi:tetratricopeptide (TPR) repeat protein